MIVALAASNVKLRGAAAQAIRAKTSSEIREVGRDGDCSGASVIVVVVGDGDPPVFEGLVNARAPVVLVGRAPTRWVPACWFRQLPSPTVLIAVLRELGGGGADRRSLPPPASPTRYLHARTEFEARYYADLLRTANGNVSMVARLAHRGRKEVYQVLKKLKLDADSFRREPAPAAEAAPPRQPRRKPASGIRRVVRAEDLVAPRDEEEVG